MPVAQKGNWQEPKERENSMYGYSYSKIKVVGNIDNSRALAMEPSDLISVLPQTLKPTSNPIEKNPEILKTQDPSSEEQQELDDQQGINIGIGKLRRNSSVSSAYALQAAVKRAFSMTRSSSVSQTYCRIHHQSVTLPSSSFDDEELDTTGSTRRSVKMKLKNKYSRDKILKAWKKLFGL